MLLVVSHLFAFSVLISWVGVGKKSKELNLDVKYFGKVTTYLALLETLTSSPYQAGTGKRILSRQVITSQIFETRTS